MCPTAISMNTYVLRIHILTDIVNLCGKSVLTRHPDTGLARLPLCQSGLWRSGGKVSAFEMVQGNDACGKYVYSKAYCPAGKQLISGGFVLSNWTGGNGWNAPDASMPSPSDNGWQIVTGGGVTGGTCMRAIAWCAKN